MKKILIIIFLLFSIISFSQTAGQSGSEKTNMQQRARRPDSKKLKRRKQMQHFQTRKSDPNIRYNGTLFRMRKQKEINNDGFTNDKKR